MTEWTWTDERVAQLRKLRTEDKLSCGEIDAIMRTTCNAIIGKLERLLVQSPRLAGGASRKYTTVPRKYSAKTAEPAIIAPKYTPPASVICEEVVSPSPDGVRFEDLKIAHCRYPLGDPREENFRFCGAAKPDITRAYCSHHARVAYAPRAERKKYDRLVTRAALRKLAAGA